ncbi:MAG: hypothetical protein LUE92_13285, partial [Clostridiales bacterium]|nr:hypothetical protein [Clostridiales bacterium]
MLTKNRILAILTAVVLLFNVIPIPVYAVTSTLAITSQPQDVTADVGDLVYFTVEATGSGLTYQWQYSSTGTKWTNSSNKTAKCGVTVTAAKNGYLYRCIITDENGDSITSDTATLTVNVLAIVTQPQDVTASVGDLVYFTVEATGSGLTYQWQ